MGTTVSDPLVGQVLDGRYRVDARIARGGMATVYQAQDLRLDRTVALKAMHPTLADDESFVARFIGEAKSAARLSHPNVVSVYDQGSSEGIVFLTMEYLPGRTVRDLLSERGRLGPDEALGIMEAVLAALGAAHQAGFIHRDVKPENVLLAGDGRIKVGDFGLARAIAASNHTKTSGLLIGTVAYLSPEQVLRGDADARSDVYSAGILLFELLTGYQPFRGETPLSVAYAHVNGEVPAPSAYAPGIPAELDGLVAAATRRDPDRRPADASGLLALTTRVRARVKATPWQPVGGEEHTLAVAPTSNETLVVQDGNDVVPGGNDVVPGGNDVVPGGNDVVPGLSSAGKDTGPGGPTPWQRSGRFLRRHRGWMALGIVLVLAAAAGGAGWYYGWGRWTEAPSLAGMTLHAANAKATRLGFDVEKGAGRFSKTVPQGQVISTDPHAGGRILGGGTITVVPSKGKRQVAVPDVHGQSPASAKKELHDAHLEVGNVTHAYSDSVPSDQVIGTDPAAGKKLTLGSDVVLTISDGVEVPGVVGRSISDAKGVLSGKGFQTTVADKRHDSTQAGTVLSQEPSNGGADKGSTITLTVSKGPKKVEVPDMRDKSVDDAEEALTEAGFKVKVEELPFSSDDPKVIKQDPPAGKKVAPDSKITLYVF